MEKRWGWLLAAIALLLLLVLLPLWFHSARTRNVEALSTAQRTVQKTPPKKLASTIRNIPKETNQTLEPLTLAELRHMNRLGTLPRLIYLPAADRGEVFRSLRRQGLPLWISDRFFLLPSRIKPGWVRLKKPISLREFFEKINDFPRERTRRVVMYSGDSLDDFVRHFSRQTRLRPRAIFDEYFRFSPYLEGGILAGYYRLPYRLSAGPAMAYLTGESEKVFARLARKYLGEYDPAGFKRYLIVASIVQRESWHPEEMPRIAAVIYNRLERGMKLQMDATLNYGPYSHRTVTPERIRSDSSRFNTYRYKGLPPEPLGSVTRDALVAALHPAKSSDLYFVRNLSGTHDFAPDYATHLANINRIKAERSRRKHSRKTGKSVKGEESPK
ncbi:endolytic transglycosylase MltG [Nitratifractor sp.]